MGLPRRRTALLGVLAVLAGVVAVRAVVPPQRTPVAAPPADASPEDVVRTYVRALDSHDCTRARSLWEDAGAEVERGCRDLAGVDDVRVRPAVAEAEGGATGSPGPPGPGASSTRAPAD
ncbi:hypothetical protein [Nocardioides aurantiacus]|uniref:hypothetical protein n=1 Tax=Nocardioides aurantiacus TaxID=86796 RepID=UPI00403F2B00